MYNVKHYEGQNSQNSDSFFEVKKKRKSFRVATTLQKLLTITLLIS